MLKKWVLQHITNRYNEATGDWSQWTFFLNDRRLFHRIYYKRLTLHVRGNNTAVYNPWHRYYVLPLPILHYEAPDTIPF